MPRYELSEGSSNKFWEIKLSGKSFTTTYGKIGASGQTTIKKFASDAEAKKEHDKIVAEKTKKGYALAGGKAAKGTPPKGVPAVKGKAAKPAAGGARYFEFSEGSSDKFWEVSIEGTTVRTRFGKIGAKGQLKIKEFESKGDAQKERDKLIAEKTKKGYAEGGGGTAADEDGDGASTVAKGDARNPALEKAIAANPFDRDAYAVFADWLQEQGDPRGELISLQLANKDKEAAKLIKAQSEYFLGPLAPHVKVYDGNGNNASSGLRTKEQEKAWLKTADQAFLWRNGYISRIRLSDDDYFNDGEDGAKFEGKLVDILKDAFEHPSGRYAIELAFQSNGDPNEDDLQDLIDLIGKKAPPTIRKITFGDNVDQISWHHTGSLAKMWKGVPNLQVLEIETGEFEVGAMDAPNLERAIFRTGGLSKACCKHIASAKMPKIKHLEVLFGTDEYGGDCTIKDVKPLLDRTDLKHLEYLGIKNSEFGNDIAKAVVNAKIVKQLKTLDLSLSTITDEGAQALADGKDALKHLECLDLTHNFLTKAGIKLVAGLCKKVVTEEQQKADDWGEGEMHYYCAVTE
jgi:uncharacterized protein (TIGR02996 family)